MLILILLTWLPNNWDFLVAKRLYNLEMPYPTRSASPSKQYHPFQMLYLIHKGKRFKQH